MRFKKTFRLGYVIVENSQTSVSMYISPQQERLHYKVLTYTGEGGDGVPFGEARTLRGDVLVNVPEGRSLRFRG